MTKHLSKEWMIENRFMSYDELKEEHHPLNRRLISCLNLPYVQSFLPDATIGDCLAHFKNINHTTSPAIPMINNLDDKRIVAVVFQ